jgi:hypothetical protein
MPLPADAASLIEAPGAAVGMAGNAICCGDFCSVGAGAGGASGGVTIVTANDRVTSVAALYVELPGCEATIVQVPVVRSVTLEPETVQTAVVELA